MRNLLTILIGLSVLAVPILGFTGMVCEGSFTCCLAKMITGKECPSDNILGSFNFHSNTIKAFLLATIDYTSFGQFMTLLSAIFAVSLSTHLKLVNPAAPIWAKSIPRTDYTPSVLKLNYWLSLHENSPSLFGAPV